MKKFILIYSVLFLLSLSPVSATQFFETLYDVPVMEGLQEIPEMALSFDLPDGRIAEAGALASNTPQKDIMAFYDVSLFQMGWEEKAANIYVREGQKLSISYEKSGSSLIVTFRLRPAGNAE